MLKRIQGITVEIGGDTTKHTTALQKWMERVRVRSRNLRMWRRLSCISENFSVKGVLLSYSSTGGLNMLNAPLSSVAYAYTVVSAKSVKNT